MVNRSRVLLLALVIDQAIGELPNAVHPVALMGRWMALGERLAPGIRGQGSGVRDRGSGVGDQGSEIEELLMAQRQLLWGAGWLVGGAGICGLVSALISRNALPQAAVASTLLSYRALDRAVRDVQLALEQGDLSEARRLLGWHLVSRPTAELSAAEVAAAAIESLAENLSDSVIAPLFWYLCGGLPAPAIYRFCNTADAMWGYRNERYEYLGKAAARCDDALNVLPARLTAALIIAAAHSTNGRGENAWRTARRDHSRTASPNAGWPMAAMAGALDTTLTKRGHYTLGSGARVPDATMIAEARVIVRRTVTIVAVLMIIFGSRG
jgi:adenosylcobinamide-phosphate synthase